MPAHLPVAQVCGNEDSADLGGCQQLLGIGVQRNINVILQRIRREELFGSKRFHRHHAETFKRSFRYLLRLPYVRRDA